MEYRIELVWNREFDWVSYGRLHDTLEEAKASAISIRDSGDGARVKKVRVLDPNNNVVWHG
jgi:hypothetical protein